MYFVTGCCISSYQLIVAVAPCSLCILVICFARPIASSIKQYHIFPFTTLLSYSVYFFWKIWKRRTKKRKKKEDKICAFCSSHSLLSQVTRNVGFFRFGHIFLVFLLSLGLVGFTILMFNTNLKKNKKDVMIFSVLFCQIVKETKQIWKEMDVDTLWQNYIARVRRPRTLYCAKYERCEEIVLRLIHTCLRVMMNVCIVYTFVDDEEYGTGLINSTIWMTWDQH